MRRVRSGSYADHEIPIYRDVTRGRGGIAGGLFTFTSEPSDTLSAVAEDYVVTPYVMGQDAYVFLAG